MVSDTVGTKILPRREPEAKPTPWLQPELCMATRPTQNHSKSKSAIDSKAAPLLPEVEVRLTLERSLISLEASL